MATNNNNKELQRKVQALVRDLRAQGKDEKQIKLAKAALKRGQRFGRSSNGSRRGGYQGSSSRGGYQGSSSRGGYQGSSSRGGYQGSSSQGGYQGSSNRGGFQDRSRGGPQADKGGSRQNATQSGFVRPRHRGPTEAQVAAEHREELGKKHDVIIIPIVWKRDEVQKEKILNACTRLKSKLVEERLNVWIDQRSKYTPGQKYAYWEHLGVTVRAEIGPKELKSKTVVLSKCTEPGTVAKRWQNISTRGNIKDLLKRLKDCGFEKINVPERQDDSAGNDGEDSEEEDVRSTEKLPTFANGDTRSQHLKLPEFQGKKRTFENVEDAGGDSLEVNYVIEDVRPSGKKKTKY